MKERKLTILLALLAALALVFAGACSDGSDDSDGTTTGGGDGTGTGTYEYTGDYSGTTLALDDVTAPDWSSAHNVNAVKLVSVELEFAESGNGVDVVVSYQYCPTSTSHSSSTETAGHVECKAVISATYAEAGGYIGIALPAGGGGDSSNEATAMTLQYDSSDEDFTVIFSTGATYKAVGDTDGTGIDIFDSSVMTSATSTFSAPSSDSEGEG